MSKQILIHAIYDAFPGCHRGMSVKNEHVVFAEDHGFAFCATLEKLDESDLIALAHKFNVQVTVM